MSLMISPAMRSAAAPVSAMQPAVKEQPQSPQELREQRQSLEEQLLLMRNTTDGAGVSQQARQALESRLEEVSAALRAAEPQAAAPETEAPRIQNAFDAFTPEPPQESPGLYAVAPGPEGERQISFSPYTGAEDAPAPEAREDGGARCTVNTDRVDAEIRRLKQEKESAAQELAQAGTPEEQEWLQRRLDALSSELSAKDNDAYRKQHATYFNE